MRGKVGDHAVIGVHHRSTPAHAGKSHCSRRRATALRDHPRACGEKPRVSSPIGRQMGSPPRMRGKGEVEAGKESVDRITPAYAGKRGRCPRPAGRRWDHPRVCGEKIRARLHPRFLVGSPPRMRGKERKRCCTATGTGITPAYAGKSRLHTSVLPWRRDHPRICGEKERWQGIWNSGVGSPPRMRGKGNVSHYHEQEPRITPAYAGKRGTGCQASEQTGDHPRVCGEKAPTLTSTVAPAGSPPRMRGKDHDGRGAAKYRGITPAYAGKSQRESWPHPA